MTIKNSVTIACIAIAFTSTIMGCNQTSKETENKNNLKTYKMELNENKKIVNEFIEAMKTSNVDKLKTMITADFSW